MRINNLFEPTEDITLESYLSKCGIDTNEYLKFRTNERYEHYPNIKKAVEAINKTITFENMLGGFLPKNKSRNIPPPTEVMHPTNTTPNRSKPRLTAINAPEIVKATVPMSSII